MAVLIAEPGKQGTWDACVVELSARCADDSLRLQQLRLRCNPRTKSPLEVGRQILQQTHRTSIESVLLLTNDQEGETPAAIVHNGFSVRIEVIDALAGLNHVIPASSASVLLIDLRTPRECVLMRRNDDGDLEPAMRLSLSEHGLTTFAPAHRNAVPAPAPGGNSRRTLVADRSGLDFLLKASRLFGITQVVIRAPLSHSSSRRTATLPVGTHGSRKSADIIFLSAREIVAGVLKASQRGHTHPRAVVLSESAGAPALTMTCRRDIAYSVLHPARPVLNLQEQCLARIVAGRPVLLVVDDKVQRLFGRSIRAYADRHLNCAGTVFVAGRERNKTWSQVQKICSHAVTAGLPRHGVIAAFGGGVAMDLAGTAASLFRRGVAYVRLPTTLVGMVDTAVGIKQGFNFAAKKNILGSFYPPLGAINDPTFLARLPQIELSCGMAEIIKMAVVRDVQFVELLEDHAAALMRSRFQSPPDLAQRVLLRAEQLMMQELQSNLYETCQARLADFGHTFSPTLERISRYTLRHGHAVAIDMLVSAGIAIARGLCEQGVLERMVHLYEQVGLPLKSSLVTVEALFEGARDSCLHRSGKLNLVVPLDFGKAVYVQDLKRKDLEFSLAMMERTPDGTKLSGRAGHSF